MTVGDAIRPVTGAGRPARAAHQLVVGPDDGYGDIALERVSLTGPEPWRGPAGAGDRLLVVVAGHAAVTLHGMPGVTLAPDEVLHVARGRTFSVRMVTAGAGGTLELIVLSGPGVRPA